MNNKKIFVIWYVLIAVVVGSFVYTANATTTTLTTPNLGNQCDTQQKLLGYDISGNPICAIDLSGNGTSSGIAYLLPSNYTYVTVSKPGINYFCLGVSENRCPSPLTIGSDTRGYDQTFDMTVQAKNSSQYSGYNFGHVDKSGHSRSDFEISNGKNVTLFSTETQLGSYNDIMINNTSHELKVQLKNHPGYFGCINCYDSRIVSDVGNIMYQRINNDGSVMTLFYFDPNNYMWVYKPSIHGYTCLNC